MTQRERRGARRPASASPASTGPSDSVAQRVQATCEDIVARHALELVECTLGRSGRGQLLRVTVDDPAGPTSLEEVEKVSEEISRALDVEDPIPGRYTLEVSSAGLERPLVRPRDYQRFAGRRVKVRTLEPIEGHRSFEGPIRSAGEDTFVLALEGGRDGDGAAVVEIPYVAVARAKLVVDWENELRGRPAHSALGTGNAGAIGGEGGQR